jgi:hypothetical protein
MAIIVEGPDNSGKSTLCQLLHEKLCMPVLHAGGPNATNDVALKCCKEQQEFLLNNAILDRVTPISRQIYENRYGEPELQDHLKKMLRTPFTTLIYCRPPNEKLMDMSSHKVREGESGDHIHYVLENQHNFIELYDRLMAGVPHIAYDWTEGYNEEAFVKMIFKTQTQVGFLNSISIGASYAALRS